MVNSLLIGLEVPKHIEIWILTYLSYPELNHDVHFLDPKYAFWAKFCPKCQNCKFKLKFRHLSNLNMQDSMILFTFFVFDQKYHSLQQFYPENQNCQFKLKFCSQSNSSMHNSMEMFTFFLFDLKYLFLGENLVHQIRIVNSS